MQLPGGDRAIIPPGKLTSYLLSPEHPRGRNKARLWRAAFGIGLDQASALERLLLDAARDADARYLDRKPYGERYRIEFVLDFSGRAGWVLSGWMLPHDGGPPFLTTAFPIRAPR